jgi:hypothetical protein
MEYNNTYDYPRCDDLVADDKQRLIDAKNDFITAMNRVVEVSGIKDQSDIQGYFLSAEESVNDMLHKAWERLCDEDGYRDDLPQSWHMVAWLFKNRKSSKGN